MKIEQLHKEHLEACIGLALRLLWPRENIKWNMLFDTGTTYGLWSDDALIASVTIPQFENANFVAMMMVDPAKQKMGLGQMLLSHAMGISKNSYFLYATAAGEPLYQKLGFQKRDAVRRLIGTPSNGASTATKQPTRHNEEWIAQLDEWASGYRRTKLIRNILKHANAVATDDESGFAARWNNGHIDIIGPVIAETESRAIALVDELLSSARGAVRIDVRESAVELMQFAISRGLVDKGRAPLMVLPKEAEFTQRENYFAIALQAFG